MTVQQRYLDFIDEPFRLWPRLPISHTVFEATVNEDFTGFMVRFYMPNGTPAVFCGPDAATTVATAVLVFKTTAKRRAEIE